MQCKHLLASCRRAGTQARTCVAPGPHLVPVLVPATHRVLVGKPTKGSLAVLFLSKPASD